MISIEPYAMLSTIVPVVIKQDLKTVEVQDVMINDDEVGRFKN